MISPSALRWAAHPQSIPGHPQSIPGHPQASPRITAHHRASPISPSPPLKTTTTQAGHPTAVRCLAVLLLVATVAAVARAYSIPPAAAFAPSTAVPAPAPEPDPARSVSAFASSKPNIRVHAASLIELEDGRLRAFWFSGSREGAPDVQIRSAVFDTAAGGWGAEEVVVTREQTTRGLSRRVKKLGNPVIARAADGELSLYYVTVSFGGWSGSSISVVSSTDDGATWQPPRRIITSPFMNLSTLVKGAPFAYADGTLGLPVYHELFGKFGELLRFDRAGNLIDKQRISALGDGGLQPVMLIEDARHATALMRDSGEQPRRVLATATRDGGRSWSAPAATSLPNPDAAVAALVLADGAWLLASNPQETGRHLLSLSLSCDRGQSWRTVHSLEAGAADGRRIPQGRFTAIVDGLLAGDPGAGGVGACQTASVRHTSCTSRGCRFRYGYPYLMQARDGDIHLAYTYNDACIKHRVFNRAWLGACEVAQ